MQIRKIRRLIQQYTCSNINESIQNVQAIKSRISGNSKEPQYDIYRSYYNKEIDKLQMPGITIVKNKSQAEHAINILKQYPDRVHAWDTETTDVDVKNESVVGKGRIVCASVFCGPEVDFGDGPRLFIDNFAQNSDLIMMFKDYLENKQFLKVWHNYSFDRHIFYNHGIDVQGFGGDTMHLARLQDPSRQPNEYSLAFQTKIHSRMMQSVKEQFVKKLSQVSTLTESQKKSLKLFSENFLKDSTKLSMTDIFGQTKLNSRLKVFPTVIQMHCNPQFVEKWVNYSTLDTEATYFLFYTLINLLRQIPTVWGRPGIANEYGASNLLDIYKLYWQPFGEILTNMERQGIYVDLEHAKVIQQTSVDHMKQLDKDFKSWVQSTQQTDVSLFNPTSLSQLQQLFYGPWIKEGPTNGTVSQEDDMQNLMEHDETEEVEYTSDGRRKPQRKLIIGFPEEKMFKIENPNYEKGNKLNPRSCQMKVKGLGIVPTEFTDKGLPSCDNAALKKLLGQQLPDGSYDGSLYVSLSANSEVAIKACEALKKLLDLRAIEVLYGTFIAPLTELVDKDQRIHCNLNINTETGRLSSRNPNMQNQPALEKDRYQVRRCFRASPGNKLVVADYGQLELRVLAHMTDCRTMIDAFNLGGDFHSRTAISMYPNIQDDINSGKVLLEWDKQKGDAPAPLLKEKYAIERKKAKTMNFSIAYGKTQTGFAKEWGIEGWEAKKIIDQWYKERQEVKQWQQSTKETSIKYGYTQTLIGRYRMTTKYFEKQTQDYYFWHGLRASINTPIQGGAADIVIAAMVKIHQNQRLKEIGYKLILQVHDELILEGPEKDSLEALQITKDLMEHPFDHELRLPLEVDAKVGDSWYECK